MNIKKIKSQVAALISGIAVFAAVVFFMPDTAYVGDYMLTRVSVSINVNQAGTYEPNVFRH